MSERVKIALVDCELWQLTEFAQTMLNLEVKPKTPINGLRTKIKNADPAITDETEILVLANEVKETKFNSAKSYSQDPTIEININPETTAGNSKAGLRDVPITVNGDMIVVRRGEWVAIPYRHYLALENAVGTHNEPVLDDKGKLQQILENDKRNYTYATRNPPTPREIAEFHARTKNEGLSQEEIAERAERAKAA